MNFENENSSLFKNFLDRTFFKQWKKDKNRDKNNFDRLEIILSPDCNLGCKYCYIHKYKHKLYPKEIREKEKILNNLDMLLDWLIDNRYTPKIDLFSGDPLTQSIGLEALEIIYNKYHSVEEKYRISSISIPTNYTFFLDEELTQKIKAMIKNFKSIGIDIVLSASFDGELIEKDNRPFIPGKYLDDGMIVKPEKEVRDDEYYSKLFEFNSEYKYGFHPMIYSNKIEMWKENFLWFQEQFKKYNIPFYNIYLLEVRNKEWNNDQIKEFGKFIEFLIKWTFSLLDGNIEKYFNFLFNLKGFNILSSPLNTIGRGLGCSLQAMLYVRLGDLSIVPCHRTMYEGYEYGTFETIDNTIVDIKCTNPELAIGVYSFEANTAPFCSTCILKHICSKGCLGSQLEETNDMFMPIPSVCKLEHYKIKSMIKAYTELGIFDDILQRVNDNKRYTLIKLKEMMGDG